MKLMEKVQNWFRKNDEAVLPVSTEPVEKEPAPDQEKKESPEEIIRKNREKASKIAMEIDILRGRLPMMMNYASIEKIREVNDVLEETEAALKGVKVATADLGNADEIAASAVREMESLLKDRNRQTEAAEALEQLSTALQEDWFGNGEENARKLRRTLSLILIKENKVVLDQQIAGMREWAGENATQLKALMDAPEDGTDRNAEILRLSNQIKKLKLGISGKETLKTDLATIQDALVYALKFATKASPGEMVRKEREAAEQEQTEEFMHALKEKQQITDRLISDNVKAETLKERMMESGIALPDMMALNDLITEFAPAEEIQESEDEKTEERETNRPILV